MTQPVGPVVGGAAAERPGPIELDGTYCRIEALDPLCHGEDLWRAFAGDETLWTYLPSGPFNGERGFAEWLDERAALLDPFSYVVIDSNSHAATGIVALLEVRPAMRVIEMGSIVYSRALQCTTAATEAQFLMARYAFEELGYRRYEWKCDALNVRSRQAALRLGFTFEGVFRQHRIVKRRNRDTAWFAMLDSEWQARKNAFERWLAPENFTPDGGQVLRISAFDPAG